MSELEQHLFELYDVGEDGNERFLGNGFRVKRNGRTVLTTAAHVAFEGTDQRNLKAKAHDGSSTIVNLQFQKKGWKDIAESELPEINRDGLEHGSDNDLLSGENLEIIYSTYNGWERARVEVKPTHVGCLSLETHPRKTINRSYENTVDHIGSEEIQTAYPGCSGSPLLTKEGKVVGVLIRGWWEKGVQYCKSVIYTQED